jgi:membrane protease YdiL (CAAX protease family)
MLDDSPVIITFASILYRFLGGGNPSRYFLPLPILLWTSFFEELIFREIPFDYFKRTTKNCIISGVLFGLTARYFLLGNFFVYFLLGSSYAFGGRKYTMTELVLCKFLFLVCIIN